MNSITEPPQHYNTQLLYAASRTTLLYTACKHTPGQTNVTRGEHYCESVITVPGQRFEGRFETTKDSC